MTIYEVKMFSSSDGKLLSTYIGPAKHDNDARVRCLRRARAIGKIDVKFCQQLTHGIYAGKYYQRYVKFHVTSYVPN